MTHKRTHNESNRLFGKIEEAYGKENDHQVVMVCVAYGGEELQEQAASDALSGWPNGLEAGFGLCHGK